ncbi:MAG: MFS transporter [Bacteroidetes bacterium]|nr:MAG: MFS transporter [Bacteroidota bacterium]
MKNLKNKLIIKKMKKQHILIALMAAVQFTHIVDFVIMMPLGPQLMRTLNINPTQFGVVVSAYTFSAAISGLIGAFFLDKYNRKSALLFLYIGFVIGTFFCALSNQFELLVAARIFTGAFGGLLGSMVMAVIGDAVAEKQRGKAIGIVMGAFSLASVVGIPIGLILATKFNWNAPFYFLGTLSLIIGIFLFKYMENMTLHLNRINLKQKWYSVVSTVLQSANQRNALLLTFLLMSGHFIVFTFLSPYLVANVGFAETQLSLIYLVGGFVTFFSSPLIGKYTDKLGKKKVYIFFALLILPIIFVVTNLPQMPVALALVITSIFFIVIGGRVIPATATATSAVEPQQRGSFMAFNASVQQLGSGVAAFLAGAIVVKNSNGLYEHFNYVGYVAIAINILSIFVISRIKANPQS